MGIDGVQRILDNIKRKATPSVEGIKSLVLEPNSQKSSLTKSSPTTSPRTGEGRAPVVTPNDKGCQDWGQVHGAINTKATTPNGDRPNVTRYVHDALSGALEVEILNDLLDALPGAG
jgi:hypothetical protein